MSGANSDTDTARRGQAASEELEVAADALRTLGMARRLQIMQLFVRVPHTLCGCEIADILELEDYQVSRDLSALKRVGLVESRERTGTWIHYQLTSEPSPTIAQLLATITQLPLAPAIEARLMLRLQFREQAGCVLGVGDPEVRAALDRASNAAMLTVLDSP